MSKQKREAMPCVQFNKQSYCLLNRKTVVPDFDEMTRLEAGLWLMKHTRAKGYQRSQNPLSGYGGKVK